MAIPRRKGKLIFVITVSLLISDFFVFVPRFSSCLVLASPPHSNSIIETDSGNANPIEENLPDQTLDSVLLKQQQLQLDKFEELVQNLTHLISRLESHFSDAPEKMKKNPPLLSPSHHESNDAVLIEEEKQVPVKEERLKEEGQVSGSMLVTKYNSFWSERFQFVSAVKLSSTPTCVNVLPYRDFEGMSKYFAVGDNNGKLYIFVRSGDISLEFNAFPEASDPSPITAMVSYLSLYKNETTIVTGHENGAIATHRVWETMLNNGDEWSSLHFERGPRFETPDSGGGGPRIGLLEVHHVGRKKYILASDNGGKITVFKENGALHGSVTPTRKPVAFLKQRLLFLTENGAGSLDLRTMKLKETECEGLNNSFARNYVFDTTDRSKAYGFTSDGDLIHTLLLGDVMNFKCRVRSKRKLDLEEPMALQAIKGYLLIANKEKVLVYNVSSQNYVRVGGGLRLLFSAGLDEIIASFLNQQVVDVSIEKGVSTIPLITSDYEKHVIISLGNGYVAMYRSNLPVFKNEFSSIMWTSPVLFFVLFLFGAWHFFANKKEALTSWGPADDPFGASSGSVMGGAPEASRSSEIMEMRGGGVGGGGGLRGSSSRYVSPPRYSGGDARFRAASDLKFRGSNVESGGVSKRRDGLFVNSQVADDSN
ncbi:hypothetical protein ABFX02_09G022100 [Erythranthe guttata]